MAFKPTTPAESRNIYVTGVTQQACAAGTIRSQEDLEAWTKKAAHTFDTVLGPNSLEGYPKKSNNWPSDKRTTAMEAFVEVIKSLSAITDLRYLHGDPTQEIGRFHDNNIALIREFANHADLYDLYTNLFRTKEGILSI